MEKIININFQGRVIPIEETAYNHLKQYIDSLRNHFASEESSDEIINDIENRIAELLMDRLKNGANCVGMTDLNMVIDSIGRLEDIEAAEGDEPRNQGTNNPPPFGQQSFKGRLFRNTDDQVIAGVCSGIAYRTGIDPIIVRIVFGLLFGALFWIYILLWIIVPAQSIRSNITRRLYRNPEDKVIAGVCGGLAVYFKLDSWIPRIIFAFPFIIGILTGGAHWFWWHWWGVGPRIFAGSFGSTLFVLYIILWIALPFASSATAKMEMRGEKIDINSIKAATQANAGGNIHHRSLGSSIGHVIATLFKAFFMFIAAIVALSLFCSLIALVITGSVAVPYTDFVLEGWGQYALAWGGIALCMGIPLLGLIIWLVRRLMGVRSQRHYLGYIFTGLWVISFLCLLTLCGILMRNFSSRSLVEQTVGVVQPPVNKVYVNVSELQGPPVTRHHGIWDGDWDENAPFQIVNNDSLWLNTVKVHVAQSDDSLFHIYETRISRGNSTDEAKTLAGHIVFNISQHDSIINLPRGFMISKKDKFRNQQVLVTIEVPVGRGIEFNKNIDNYNWFNINTNGRKSSYMEVNWDDDDDDYNTGSEYKMTPTGLKNPKDSTDKINTEEVDDKE